MAAGSARLLRPLILRDLLVALENAEIHNERLTGQCFLDPKSQKEEAPVPQPALKLQKNCCAARFQNQAPSTAGSDLHARAMLSLESTMFLKVISRPLPVQCQGPS